MELSFQEEYVINVLRELKPHETITIVKDQTGRPNHYLVSRSQKIVVSEMSIVAIK